MSEEKRKNVRLQGRFSDEHRPPRKDKQKRSSDQYGEEGSSKSLGKGRSSNSQSVPNLGKSDLQYDEHANVSFKALEEKPKPVEIKTCGQHILSNTANGESRVYFEPNFIPEFEAAELMTQLHHSTEWYNKNIIIHGQEVAQPRLVAWYGPFPYSYSGAVLEAKNMTPTLLTIKDRVENHLKLNGIDVTLNSVLLNMYRNEKDSVAWHSDDELTMGICPTIASVSLGEVRKFQMRMKPHVCDNDKNLATEYFINLTPGSLVVMDGCMQDDWKHQVPKEYHDKGPRINLTFRTVYSIDKLPSQVPLIEQEESSHSVPPHTKETKHIFNMNNFPPLCDNIIGLEKSNGELQGSTIAPYQSKSNEKFAVPNISLQTDNSQNLSSVKEQDLSFKDTLKTCLQTESSLESYPAVVVGNQENVYVAADVGFNNSLIEEVSYMTEVPSEGLWDGGNSNNFGVCELGEPSVSMRGEKRTNQEHRSSQLNAGASEFVPKWQNPFTESEFNKVALTKLADWFESGKVSPSQFEEFSKVLTEKIYQNIDDFTYRDHHELEVLCTINDNSQTDKNRKIILSRLCSMIHNAKARSGWYKSQPYRAYDRDNAHHKNSYRRNSYEPRNQRY